jgi:hypothetical protein
MFYPSSLFITFPFFQSFCTFTQAAWAAIFEPRWLDSVFQPPVSQA